MASEVLPGPAPSPTGAGTPQMRVPSGGVDAHIHILLPGKYPYTTPSERPSPAATAEEYRQVQRRLGLHRAVVVTPSNYGTDNRCTLEAIAQLGPSDTRGIAVVDARTTAEELSHLDGGGFRGIRFNATRPGGAPVDQITHLARKAADLGWHVQLHVPTATLVERRDALLQLPADLVLDHAARIPGGTQVDDPAFRIVLDLLDAGRTWVKIGGLYQGSTAGAPSYTDRALIAAELLRRFPERLVWGSDWPHTPALRGEMPMPDDAGLLGILARAASPEVLSKVLVSNPTELYGFGPWQP